MASTSEKTFGSRLNNAQQLATHLSTFAGYTEIAPECSVANYTTLLADINTNNTLIATTTSQFSLAVETRAQLFTKNAQSLNKTLAPISAYVKAKFGKTSKEATDIVALVNKIRGEKTDKLKKDEQGEFVSQSERSYGSQTQHFSNIIATLTNYGAGYTPTTNNITIAKLTTQLAQLTNANTQVTTAYGILKPAIDTRTAQYIDLNSRTTRIKDTVKSQYGVKSTEYKLIKGFNI